MDIVRIITFAQFKATHTSLRPKQKIFLSIFLLAIFLNLFPNQTHAFTIKAPTAAKPILVFDSSDKSYQNVIDYINNGWLNRAENEKAREEAVQKGRLAVRLHAYLTDRRSPLADYSGVLVSVKNWKQIIALANAESSMCRTYPEKLANCWGVGGAQLWDMGQTLGDGVLEMNKFLGNYPLRSKVKYSQMTFNQMNGLYKQPAAAHWLYNVQSVYDDLVAIENNI
jgi:hypothetical protein